MKGKEKRGLEHMENRKAPKDPEKQRSFFYIMQDKDIFGAPQKDGRGIQFIYENDGRLINSAQIVGQIEDKAMLDCLRTTEGFRKMVHSIGVTVETEDTSEPVEFAFQMYGKQDIYGGGTTLRQKQYGNGAEYRICLEEIEWSEDDAEPGQIRFEMEHSDRMAKVSVRFFLNDGYTAPEQSTQETVDVNSPEYHQMIERSLVTTGNYARLQKVIQKAQSGKDVTLSYIGGSITQGAGATPIHTKSYAYQSWKSFKEAFQTKGNVKLIKAGVGGTPSELGMIRFERDILREDERPDLVVIEFAVNDEGDETKGNCYESLIRKALQLSWRPAVVLLFSVFADDTNLQERLQPIGTHYDLPMVSLKNAVTPQFYDTKETGRVLTKNQYFYDIFHPTNLGHQIMADCLQNLFEKVAALPKIQDTAAALLTQAPRIGASFPNIHLMDRKDLFEKAKIEVGSFAKTDTQLQCVEMDDRLEAIPEFPYNWYYDGKEKDPQPFKMEITCKALVLVFKDCGEVNSGKAEVFLDGEKIYLADPKINGWVHCNPKILFDEAESRTHVIEIKMLEEDKEKTFTILGFGYVK